MKNKIMKNFDKYFNINESENNGSKTYYAYLKQLGDGCDYTIGCAQTMIVIKSDTYEEAILKLEEIIDEEYYDDTKLEDAMIFECEPTHIDLDNLYTMKQKNIDKSKQQIIEDKEKSELKRLLKKYN